MPFSDLPPLYKTFSNPQKRNLPLDNQAVLGGSDYCSELAGNRPQAIFLWLANDIILAIYFYMNHQK